MDENLIPRFFPLPQTGSFFLFGPRGTGKTTLLKQKFSEKAIWIDFNDPESVRFYSAKPERLEAVLLAQKQKTVIIDEVQRVPEILTVVHKLIESDKDLHFILTGSSSRKLKRTGVDLLAGRAVLKRMHPFLANELGTRFHITDALQFGLLPLVYNARDKFNTLRTYVALYIKEEVQTEGLVRNIGGFSRFVEAVSFSHGSILNTANIARECQVERKVVGQYIDILNDLMLSFTLPVFSKKAKRAVTTHPKFYYFDAGVFSSIRPKGPFDRPEEIEGAALEGLVAQHLKAWTDLRDDRDRLYFWRTQAGSEVDFIIYGESGIFAFEVKNSDTIRHNDLKHLKAFLQDYPTAKGFFLYRGKQKLKIDGILCVSCQEFLPTIGPGTAFNEYDQLA